MESKEEDICHICLDEYTNDTGSVEEKTITECSHTFHSRCLGVWVKRSRSCPLCRTELKVDKPMTLHDACKKGDLELIKKLINKDTINDINNCNQSILMWVCNTSECSVDVVKLLIDEGADVNLVSEYNETALMFASFNCSIEKIRLLLQYGGKRSINTISNYNNTALISAITGGGRNLKDVVRLLVRSGARYNEDVIILALQNGYYEIAQLLTQ